MFPEPTDSSATDAAKETSTQGLSEPTMTPQPRPEIDLWPKYVLGKLIGQGGMGSVYLGEQLEPVRRRVAIKLIRAGRDSKRVLARFEAERQALAMMEHPAIARVLDAGATAGGEPYFAMEYVDGRPLTAFCDQHQFSVEVRLELLATVCDAVQHAHVKGVVHRDLKPSNILVTQIDGKPIPKVIDFGLAKALAVDTPLANESMLTETGQVLGTIRYMSPEQAGFVDAPVGEGTDIYALGVLLYELLTGTVPLDDSRHRHRGVVDLLNDLRDHDPPRPSQRFRDASDSVKDVVRQRATDSRELDRVLSGDLDWIVMKAIERDRSRRYETAAAMASDLRRYLLGEPVAARPPSRIYRMRKYVRRHRGWFASGTVVALTLIGGLVGTTGFAVDAIRARDRARAAAQLARDNERLAIANRREALDMVDSFFVTVSADDLLNEPGMSQLRTRLLDRAVNFYERMLANVPADDGSPLLLADARLRYASLLDSEGQIRRARVVQMEALKALDEYRSAAGDSMTPDEKFISAQTEVRLLRSMALRRPADLAADPDASVPDPDADEPREPLQTIARALEILRNPPVDLATVSVSPGDGQLPPITAATQWAILHAGVLKDHAEALLFQGQNPQAMASLEAGLALLADVPGGETLSEVQESRADMLMKLANMSPYLEGKPHRQTAVAIRRKIVAAHPTDVRARYALAMLLQTDAWLTRQENDEEALAGFSESESIFAQVFRENPTVRVYRINYARTLDLHAYTLHQSTINGPASDDQEAGLRKSMELYRDAESLLLRTDLRDREGLVDSSSQAQSDDPQLLAMIYNGQALVLRDLNDKDGAMACFENALEIQSAMADATPDDLYLALDASGTLHNMGRTCNAMRDFAEAVGYFRRSLEWRDRLLAAHPDAENVRYHRATTILSMATSMIRSLDIDRIRNEYRDAEAEFEYLCVDQQQPLTASWRDAKIADRIARMVTATTTDQAADELSKLESEIQGMLTDGQEQPMLGQVIGCFAATVGMLDAAKWSAPADARTRLVDLGRVLIDHGIETKQYDESIVREDPDAEPFRSSTITTDD